MCAVSAVFDHYRQPFQPYIPWTNPTPTPREAISIRELNELKKLIAEFKEVVQAARLVDLKTGQPDCEDPVKAELETRVTKLEALVSVLTKGAIAAAKC